MARVTVTDCLEHVDNRFQLVLIASKRARQLLLGAEPLVERNHDKPTVLALREIAEGLIDASILDEEVEVLDPFGDAFGEPFDERELDAHFDGGGDRDSNSDSGEKNALGKSDDDPFQKQHEQPDGAPAVAPPLETQHD